MTTSRQSEMTGLEIAVIGMAGRFPGARNIGEFWDNLTGGIESLSFFSHEELEKEGLDSRLLQDPDYVNVGAVLEDIEYFDASFFGYTPGEAQLIDPQVRLFHECAWETLEDAGYDPDSYPGLIGVYAGGLDSIVWKGKVLLSEKGKENRFSASLLSSKDFLSTRLSYVLNLKGPSVVINTACSTSLVTIHMACRALLGGECHMALAGGVSLSLNQKNGYLHQEGMIYSSDGHTRPFDAKADGSAFGSGIGVVLLKPLENALSDRDAVYAVVKGIAINNDGKRKVGYTAPSVKGQSEVIRAAMRMAEVEPGSISYVEAHGTGTRLGDPIELKALNRVFKSSKRKSCAIGSVKSNFGHLNIAAGVAGFIKTVLALKHKLIPPSLHYERPNPEIDFENSPFYVNTQLTEWKNERYSLRAGVSSFGIGGTNAHAVLEEAPRDRGREAVSPLPGTGRLMLLSANTGTALEKITVNLVEYLKKNPGINPDDMAYTLQIGRRSFRHRKMFICSTVGEAIDALSSKDYRKTHVFQSPVPPVIIFMFAGLGSQYVNMGLGLYKTVKVFREEADRCFRILDPLLKTDIKRVLYPDEINPGGEEVPGPSQGGVSGTPAAAPGINRVDIAQVVVFIFGYALARLMMAWGIKPEAMIGYSFGEYIAACISGVLSLEDALKLVVIRGRLIKKLPVGAMLSVPLPKSELIPLLNISDELSLAIDNGPSCIVSGSEEAISTLEKHMKEKKYLCIRLQASHALHSKMMEPILDEFENEIKEITLNEPQIPYISNVTGSWITPREAADPDYWRRHLAGTVQFADGVNELVKEKNAVFLEIGPGRDLSAFMVRYIDNNSTRHCVNLIRPPEKNVSDNHYLLQKIGLLWLWGVDIGWNEFYSGTKRCRLHLPTYPFEGRRFWIDEEINISGIEKSPKAKKGDIADWFYIPAWKRSPLMRGDKIDRLEKQEWLVFLDEEGLGTMVVDRLRNEGHTVITAVPGTEYKRLAKGTFVINPSHGNDYDKLFHELSKEKAIPGRIIHLWGVTAGKPCASVERAQYKGFYSLVHTARAIGKQEKGVPETIEINVVTDNVQSIAGEEVLYPEKAAVLGPVKVIPQEQPGITCRSIDIILPAPGTWQRETILDLLWDEFSAKCLDIVVAIRENQRWVQTFEPVHLEGAAGDIPKLRKKGVYLITGGLGKIGYLLSEYLIKNFQARLILTGRTPLPPKDKWDRWLTTHQEEDGLSRKILKLQALEKLGGEVLAFGVDVSDLERMKDIVAHSEKRFGQINGVIHAAGDMGKSMVSPMEQVSEAECRRQFLPKIDGLLILETVLRDKDLDFCFLTSSLSPILGGLGFAAYSAANVFMDAFVQKINRESPVHWISVNWADWRFALSRDQKNTVGSAEFALAMTPEEGVETFQRILYHCNVSRVVVSSWDLQTRIDKWVKLKSLRDEEHVEEESPPALKSRPILMNPYMAPCSPLEQKLADIWQKLLGIERIGATDDFFELGGDSLKGIIANSRIFKELKVKIPLKVFYRNPTIKLLSDYIGSAESSEFFSIEPAEEKEYYPASLTQKRFYILQSLDPGNIGYNISFMLLIEGDLEKDKLERTFKKLTMRHESLRTHFELIDGEVVQKVLHEAAVGIEFYEAPEEEIKQIVHDFVRPFDLDKWPLLRVGLVRLGDARHMLIVDMHHIITDGLSSVILSREFTALYAGKNLPPQRLQYTDYSEWQSSRREQERIKEQGEFWAKQFEDRVPLLKLRTDYSRPSVQRFQGKITSFEIAVKETEALRDLVLQEESSLFTVLFAIYGILLRELTGQADIVIGTGVLNRSHPDLMNIIGLFFNTLPLRCRIGEEKTFREFLKDVQENQLEAFENQDYPFDMLVEDLMNRGLLIRDTSRNPLFDTMFALQNFGVRTESVPEAELTGLTVKPHELEKKTSRFDLFLEATQRPNTILMRLEYSTVLFKFSTARKIADYYMEILHQVLADRDIKISDITISNKPVQVKSTVEQKEYMNFGF